MMTPRCAAPGSMRPPEEELKADLAVIGGGLAGMGAALAAARPGDRVVLIERRQWLGGERCGSSAAGGDEESADEMIDRLGGANRRTFRTSPCLLGAEAFATFEGWFASARSHWRRCCRSAGARHRCTAHRPRHRCRSSGCRSLPAIARPGVVGALAAFHRAERFGVWIGHQRAVSTTASARLPGRDARPRTPALRSSASPTPGLIRNRASSSSARPMASR